MNSHESLIFSQRRISSITGSKSAHICFTRWVKINVLFLLRIDGIQQRIYRMVQRTPMKTDYFELLTLFLSIVPFPKKRPMKIKMNRSK